MTPIGTRVTAPTPPKETTKRSFSQSETWMSGGTVARIPARSKVSRSFSVRALGRRSSSPKRIECTCPRLRMRPGATIQLNVAQRPPTTRSGPRTPTSCLAASTPFWSGTTKVSGPSMGPSRRADSSTCQVLTPRRITSTGPASAGSSVAFKDAGGIRISSESVSTTSPSRRMASRCAPRAMKTTSSPAFASLAPKCAPAPPVP